MGIFNKIFRKKEKINYKIKLGQISNPLMDKIDEISEKEVRGFFKVVLDATERSLRIKGTVPLFLSVSVQF